jgi:hypothetical protein
MGIMRNRRGADETVAPQKMALVKDKRCALPFGKRARKGDRPMATCVLCKRNVSTGRKLDSMPPLGGFAIFHWRCFAENLRAESEEQVESEV